MTRSVIVTVVRNPETDERRTIMGKYSVVGQHREGFTEIESQEVKKYVMSDDVFFKYAVEVE